MVIMSWRETLRFVLLDYNQVAMISPWHYCLKLLLGIFSIPLALSCVNFDQDVSDALIPVSKSSWRDSGFLFSLRGNHQRDKSEHFRGAIIIKSTPPHWISQLSSKPSITGLARIYADSKETEGLITILWGITKFLWDLILVVSALLVFTLSGLWLVCLVSVSKSYRWYKILSDTSGEDGRGPFHSDQQRC